MPKQIEMENINEEEKQQQLSDIGDKEQEILQQQMQISSEEEEEEQEEDIQDGELMYMTELPNQGESKQKVSKQEQPQQVESKESLKENVSGALGYDEFLQQAQSHLGDQKEYDQHYDLNTAYKNLKNVLKRPDSFDYKDFSEPNYLKPTAAIQRYKMKGNLNARKQKQLSAIWSIKNG